MEEYFLPVLFLEVPNTLQIQSSLSVSGLLAYLDDAAIQVSGNSASKYMVTLTSSSILRPV